MLSDVKNRDRNCMLEGLPSLSLPLSLDTSCFLFYHTYILNLLQLTETFRYKAVRQIQLNRHKGRVVVHTVVNL